MYLFGSFPRSNSTTHHTKTAIANLMTVLYPQKQSNHIHHSHRDPYRQTRNHHHSTLRRPKPTIDPQSAEDIFLHALARASLCKKHARPHSTNSRPHARLQRPDHSHNHTTSRDVPPRPSKFSTNNATEHAANAIAALPREELRSIVELYDYEFDTEPIYEQPRRRTPIPVPVEDIPPQPQHQTLDASAPPPEPRRELPGDALQYTIQIQHVIELLENQETPHDDLFEAYQALPDPRISYLDDVYIRKIMHHFSVVEFRTEQSMLRYLSLVDDLTAANIPMTTGEWNSAISFAGRWLRRVSDVQVETATQIWLRMEREAGVKSDNITFNILFDVAAKAGKFALAEMIMKEMITRGLPANRYFRTNKIYYYGIKRDGAAVRRAYKDLVDAGEFVDTTVLNCVIASLIRAGEASAAEHIFERMKSIDAEKTGSKPVTKGWRKHRELGRVLDRAARLIRKRPEKKSTVQEAVQEATPIKPNMHTYRLLIRYHAQESGNIDRVTDLLDEMHDMRIDIHGSVFFQLFKGFQLHGGVRYSSWTRARLDKLWAVFLEFVKRSNQRNQESPAVLDEEDKGCYYDAPVVIIVLQAYNRVSGKETAMAVWEEILDKWKPEGRALDAVNGALADMWAFNRD